MISRVLAPSVSRSRAELAALTTLIEELDRTLRTEFPEYAELTAPRPVDLKVVRRALRADEALLLHVTSPQATYVFLVTSKALKIARTELNHQELQHAVASIRKGLVIQDGRPPDIPFDTHSAHLLYQRLLQPFKEELRTVKHLVAVLDRAMQKLPLSLLLESPAPRQHTDFRKLDFLVKRFAVSVVPSLSSFTALRSMAKATPASRPFIGFGDPILKGSGKPASTPLVSRR